MTCTGYVVWLFRPGRRIAHARLREDAATSPCGQALAGTRAVSTHNPNHVGIRPCHVCRQTLTVAGLAADRWGLPEFDGGPA